MSGTVHLWSDANVCRTGYSELSWPHGIHFSYQNEVRVPEPTVQEVDCCRLNQRQEGAPEGHIFARSEFVAAGTIESTK